MHRHDWHHTSQDVVSSHTSKQNETRIDDVSITEIRASDLSAYKVVPDSDGSLVGYNSICSHGTKPPTDWSAMYLQFQSDHVLGTVPYRWERGHTNAKLVEVTFHDLLTVVVIDGPIIYDGTISGKEKATRIKQLMGNDVSLPLMEYLGKQGKMAAIRGTEHEWELIISHSLLSTLSFTKTEVALFERHSRMPVTHRRRDSNQTWHAWIDTSDADNHIRNLSTDWIH